MLTVIALIVVGPRLVVHLDEHALEGIVEVTLPNQRVVTEEDLVILGHVGSLEEVVAEYEVNRLLLEDAVVRNQGVAHCLPKLLSSHEMAEVVANLMLRVPIEPFYHLLLLDVKAGV